jgi:hypothetical protein
MANRKRRLMLKEVFLSEISREESHNYYKDIKLRKPELFTELETLARAIVRYQSKDATSSELVEPFMSFLTKHQETNPIHTGDTLGVKMFLDVLSKDAESAGLAKRLYDNIFNSMLRKRYDK